MSSSSTGHLSCIVVRPSHRCRRCRRCRRRRRYLVGLIVCPPHCRCRLQATCPAKASSPSLSGGGSRRLSPTIVIVVIGHLPHHRSCRRPRATCPAKASSPSLSGGGYVVCPPPLSSLSLSATPHIVVVVVVHGPFVLWRLHRRHRLVGASSSVPRVIVVSRPPHRHCCCCCWGSSSTPHVIVVRGSFVLWRPHPRDRKSVV